MDRYRSSPDVKESPPEGFSSHFAGVFNLKTVRLETQNETPSTGNQRKPIQGRLLKRKTLEKEDSSKVRPSRLGILVMIHVKDLSTGDHFKGDSFTRKSLEKEDYRRLRETTSGLKGIRLETLSLTLLQE